LEHARVVLSDWRAIDASRREAPRRIGLRAAGGERHCRGYSRRGDMYRGAARHRHALHTARGARAVSIAFDTNHGQRGSALIAVLILGVAVTGGAAVLGRATYELAA